MDNQELLSVAALAGAVSSLIHDAYLSWDLLCARRQLVLLSEGKIFAGIMPLWLS